MQKESDKHMERTVFSPYQLRFINLLGQVRSDEQMNEINNLLSRYFAQKAIEEADRLWDQGIISEPMINEWKNEHMRTTRK